MKKLWLFLSDRYSTPKEYKSESIDNNIRHLHILMLVTSILCVYVMTLDIFFKNNYSRFSFLLTYDIIVLSVSVVAFLITILIYRLKIKSVLFKQSVIYFYSTCFFALILLRLLFLDDPTDIGYLISSLVYFVAYCMCIVLLFDINPLFYIISMIVCAVVMRLDFGSYGILGIDISNLYIFCIALLVSSMYKRRKNVLSMKQQMQLYQMNQVLDIQAQQLQLQQSELNATNEELLAQKEVLIHHKENLEKEVHEQTKELRERNEKIISLQNHTIVALSMLVENRDVDTGDHVKRTAAYVKLLTQKALDSGKYSELTQNSVELFTKAAPMHDIGKIVVPDAILKKPDKLSDEEYEQIKRHTTEGGRIVREILGEGENEEYIKVAQDIATYHHEKYNGSGYPKGLVKDDIPLSARIVAVADVFDSLVSVRCYKKSLSIDEAFDIIKKESGVHFDPTLVEIFISQRNGIIEIMNHYEDK